MFAHPIPLHITYLCKLPIYFLYHFQAVAIAGNADSPSIRIYDGRGASTPLKIIEKMHMKPVSCMIYVRTHHMF